MGYLARPLRPWGLAVAQRLPALREHAGVGVGGIGHRLRQRPVGLLVDPLLGRRADRVDVDAVRAQLLLVARDRIARRPFLEHFTRAVLVVGVGAMSGSIDTMPTQPIDLSPKCMLPSRPRVGPPSRPM